ncbi:MAG TPA: putative LPS assembly protein LptD [Bacteroidota bacterium]|nr:putative LPS assembly protein LptD [Bacteroidota bacterium]
MLGIFRNILCLLFVFSAVLIAQTQDTIKTSATDTTRASKSGGIDTVIVYSAKDSIVYSLKTRYMYLYSECEMQYQTINLKSERIDVNWDTATLTSYGVQDTVHKDSVVGKPILQDGGDKYYGERIDYNFRTQKGRIVLATTQMDNGYYEGETIKKISRDELFISNGRYTTCDAPQPHFYFDSPKMKVYVRDILVAEPVYLYISDVPIFALPFGIFPSHGGRASGIISPAYGRDMDYGWYLSHLGYYWAASDYWDIATMFDVYARGKWMDQTEVNYALRDVLKGNLNTRITSLSKGESSDPDRISQRDYYAHLTHNQIISPTSNLDVDFTFASSTFFKNYSTNINEILAQNIVSNATYSKSWPSSNRSMSLSFYRDQNLITEDVNERLPSLSFTKSQFYPFKSKKERRGTSNVTSESKSFGDLFGMNYSARFTNDNVKQSKMFDSAFTAEGWKSDVKEFSNIRTLSFDQGAAMNISPKLGHFTISPSLSWSESRRAISGSAPVQIDSAITRSDTSKWETAGYLNAAISTNTRFYGLAQPNILGITAFRHTVTPTLALSYNKKIYGVNIPKYQLLASMGVGNLFEIKKQKDDSSQSEDKIQLLNLSVATSYNFAADSMNFNDLNLNYRTAIGSIISLSGAASYTFYKFDPVANNGYGSRVNTFLLSSDRRFADLKSFSFSISTSLKGKQKESKRASSSTPQSVIDEQEQAKGGMRFQQGHNKYETLYEREEADFSIPWNLYVSYSFSQYQNDPRKKSRTSSANIDFSFNLTEKWKIQTRGSYDFVTKQHYIQSLDITRDLHCWQMNFTYYPMGTLAGYRFEIRVAAPQLQDVKITKQNTRPY